MRYHSHVVRMGVYILYLAIPVSASLFFSTQSLRDIHLLLACGSMMLSAAVLISLSRTVQRPFARFALAFIPASVLFWFGGLEFISYYLQGESFNDRFFYYIGFSTITTGLAAYTWLAVLPLIITILVGGIDWFILKHESFRPHRSRHSRPLYLWAILGSMFILLPSAPQNFFITYRQYWSPHQNGNVSKLLSELHAYHVMCNFLLQCFFLVNIAPC